MVNGPAIYHSAAQFPDRYQWHKQDLALGRLCQRRHYTAKLDGNLHVPRGTIPDADRDRDSDGNSHSDGYANCDSNSYAYANSYRYSNSNCYSNGDCDHTAAAFTDGAASTDTAAAPLGSRTS